MSLKDEIDKGRTTIHTDGYSMSVGELMSMYKDGEMDIHPEFQRFYRWKDTQKSRLIESLLLGIPIPSIFVAQRPDGVWDVVDGLQRLSTIFELTGILKNEEDEIVPPLVLKGTKYLPSLEGKRWEDDEHPENSLDSAQRMIVKRAKLDIKIILRESDPMSQLELFQRLNTGGSQLSDQEVRNATLIMVNRAFYRWLRELAKNEDFSKCIALTERQIEEQFDLELIVRFLVLRQIAAQDVKKIADVGEFLTDRIIALAQDPSFDQKAEEEAFAFTFAQLNASLEDNSFRRYDPKKRRFLGPFLLSGFEAITLGLGYNHRAWVDSKKTPPLEKLVKSLWSNLEFLGGIGSGVSASYRLPVTMEVGRKLFKP